MSWIRPVSLRRWWLYLVLSPPVPSSTAGSERLVQRTPRSPSRSTDRRFLGTLTHLSPSTLVTPPPSFRVDSLCEDEGLVALPNTTFLSGGVGLAPAHDFSRRRGWDRFHWSNRALWWFLLFGVGARLGSGVLCPSTVYSLSLLNP